MPKTYGYDLRTKVIESIEIIRRRLGWMENAD